MNQIYIDGKLHAIPGKWDELSPEQYKRLVSLMCQDLLPSVRTAEYLLVLFKAWKNFRLSVKFHTDITLRHLAQMRPATRFIDDPAQLTKNLVPILNIKGADLYGPVSELASSSFIEYVRAEGAYSKYLQTNKEQYLDRLVAVLYRPKSKEMDENHPDWNGDLREKYNDFKLNKRIEQVASLSFPQKVGVFLFYRGCRMKIVGSKQFKNVFVRAEGKTKNNSTVTETFTDALFKIAGAKFGDFEKTAFTNMYLVLKHLDNTIKTNKKAQEEIDKARGKK